MLHMTEVFEHGEVTIRVHKTSEGEYVVADQAGWLDGVFHTAELALAHGKKANDIS